ncbi:LacI family DNA-binding transcriptional regulator [Bifidobacterium goeldii]|nr:LacI family DNA-binding transcriptional regulator [Bifidobacterium goeldii]
MADVAALVGVTKTTVSRYINKRSYVSPATAKKIEAAMRELDFTPNRIAKALSQQHTNVVIYVIHGNLLHVAQDPGLNTHYASAGLELARHGYQILSMTVDSEISINQLKRLITERFADGYLFSPNHDDDPLLQIFADSGVPVVTAGNWNAQADMMRAVDSDNCAAMKTMGEYLIHHGRSHIAYVAGPQDNAFSCERINGLRDACSKAGIAAPSIFHLAAWNGDDLDAVWSQIEPILPSLDAIAAANDIIAANIIQRLQARAYRVPEDIAVTGFDNTPIAANNKPPITTIDQHLDQHGTMMADVLMTMIDNEPVPDSVIYVPTELVIRESA